MKSILPAKVDAPGGSIHDSQGMASAPGQRAVALKLKLAVALPVAGTVTVMVLVPSFSCQASISYFPGGRPLMLKLPSAPLTAKNGCEKTLRLACIQLCTLHCTGMSISSVVKVLLVVMPLVGWLM